MKVEGVSFFGEDVSRMYEELINQADGNYEVTMEDAIKASESAYRCGLYEKYLVAKLEKHE